MRRVSRASSCPFACDEGEKPARRYLRSFYSIYDHRQNIIGIPYERHWTTHHDAAGWTGQKRTNNIVIEARRSQSGPTFLTNGMERMTYNIDIIIYTHIYFIYFI